MVARLAIGCLLAGPLVAGAAWARPLDLADPTPRTIQVEFEVSYDPSAVAQTWSVPFEATYSVSGNTGTVVIGAPEYESAIQTRDLDYFGALVSWSLIPGSVSDFELGIDLTTLEATAPPASYQVFLDIHVPQDGTVTRELGTATTAGYAFLPEYPGFPFFCDFCALVPGAPYDPGTGIVNAVGVDELVAPDVTLRSFSRAGDLRLSELPAPAVPVLSGPALLLCAALLAGLARLRIRSGPGVGSARCRPRRPPQRRCAGRSGPWGR